MRKKHLDMRRKPERVWSSFIDVIKSLSIDSIRQIWPKTAVRKKACRVHCGWRT